MSDQSKLSVRDLLFNLLPMTGAMLIIMAVPAGVVFGFDYYNRPHSDRHEAIIVGIVMTTTMFLVGTLLYYAAKFIWTKRRRGMREDHNT